MFPFYLVCVFLKFISVHMRMCLCMESLFTLVEFVIAIIFIVISV